MPPRIKYQTNTIYTFNDFKLLEKVKNIYVKKIIFKLNKLSVKKTLLIIGGGFFGKSILDFMLKKKGLEKKIKKIIIITKSSNIFLSKRLRKKFIIDHIKLISLKLKVPYADLIIYCVISNNYKLDHKGVKNFYNIAKQNFVNSKIIYTSSGAVYGKQKKINLELRSTF